MPNRTGNPLIQPSWTWPDGDGAREKEKERERDLHGVDIQGASCSRQLEQIAMFALLLFAYASTGSANDRCLVYRYLAKAVDTACFLSAVTKQAVCRDSLTSSPSISVKTNRMYALHTSAFKNCQRYQRCTHTQPDLSWPLTQKTCATCYRLTRLQWLGP